MVEEGAAVGRMVTLTGPERLEGEVEPATSV